MAYYAVVRGFQPGVYRTWKECKEQVEGYEKICQVRPVYKKFETLSEARAFVIG